MDQSEREAFEAYAQLPKFKKRIDQALETIQKALDLGPAYVAVSWGKDSTVLLHLCQQVQPDILAAFCSTEQKRWLDNFNEVKSRYANLFGLNYLEVMLTPDNWIPGSTIRDISGKYLNNANVFLGLRKTESKARKISLSKYGQIHQYQSKQYRFCPLSDWNWDDIWAYIVINNLPYLGEYDHSAKNSASNRTSVFLGAEATTDYMTVAHSIARLNSPAFAQWQAHNQDLIDLIRKYIPFRDGIMSIDKAHECFPDALWINILKDLSVSTYEDALTTSPYLSLVKWEIFRLLTKEFRDESTYPIAWRSCQRGKLLQDLSISGPSKICLQYGESERIIYSRIRPWDNLSAGDRGTAA